MESVQALKNSVVHFLRCFPGYLSTGLIAGSLAGLIFGDYMAWKSNGTGGTPPTLKGYLRMRRMTLYILFHPSNLHDHTLIPAEGPSYLKSLPVRKGGRPRLTRWTLPQRQFPEPITEKAKKRLNSLIPRVTSEYITQTETRASKTEGGTGPAIYIKPDTPGINPSVKNIFYEVAHVHPSENSLHVFLSPRDAREVVERGWGVRFPVYWIAPKSWVMVFAPRDEGEVGVVEGVVRAAVRFNAGLGEEGE